MNQPLIASWKPDLFFIEMEAMTKPKPEWIGTKEQWYKAGLPAGEKRLARALRRWVLSVCDKPDFKDLFQNDVLSWLTARAKGRKP